MSLAILDALTPRCYPRAMPMPHATPGRTLMPVLMAIRVHAFLLPHPPSHSQPPHTDYRFPLRPAYVTPSGCVAGAHLHDKEYAAPCPDPRLMSMIPRMQRRITLQSAMDWARDLDFDLATISRGVLQPHSSVFPSLQREGYVGRPNRPRRQRPDNDY